MVAWQRRRYLRESGHRSRSRRCVASPAPPSPSQTPLPPAGPWICARAEMLPASAPVARAARQRCADSSTESSGASKQKPYGCTRARPVRPCGPSEARHAVRAAEPRPYPQGSTGVVSVSFRFPNQYNDRRSGPLRFLATHAEKIRIAQYLFPYNPPQPQQPHVANLHWIIWHSGLEARPSEGSGLVGRLLIPSCNLVLALANAPPRLRAHGGRWWRPRKRSCCTRVSKRAGGGGVRGQRRLVRTRLRFVRKTLDVLMSRCSTRFWCTNSSAMPICTRRRVDTRLSARGRGARSINKAGSVRACARAPAETSRRPPPRQTSRWRSRAASSPAAASRPSSTP